MTEQFSFHQGTSDVDTFSSKFSRQTINLIITTLEKWTSMWITNKNSHWTQPQNKLGLWVTWVDRDASSDNDVQCDLDQRFTRTAAFLKMTLLDSMTIFVYVFRSSKSWVALDVEVWRFFEAFEGGVAEDDGLVLAPEPVCHDQLRHLILVVAIRVAWNQKNYYFYFKFKGETKTSLKVSSILAFFSEILGALKTSLIENKFDWKRWKRYSCACACLCNVVLYL